MSNFILEAKENNHNIKIILVSHDWAQHNLAKENISYMPNNISNIISSFSIQFSDFVEVIHISLDDYPESSSLEKIFKYPKDIFSHLKNSKVLSEKIGKKIYNSN